MSSSFISKIESADTLGEVNSICLSSFQNSTIPLLEDTIIPDVSAILNKYANRGIAMDINIRIIDDDISLSSIFKLQERIFDDNLTNSEKCNCYYQIWIIAKHLLGRLQRLKNTVTDSDLTLPL